MSHQVLEKEIASARQDDLTDRSENPFVKVVESWGKNPKIAASRYAPLESPFMSQKRHAIPVARKLSRSRTTYVSLRMDEKTKEFSFKCLQQDLILPVERSQLVNAMAEVPNSEWVCLRLGIETLFRLKRADLRSALHELEKL